MSNRRRPTIHLLASGIAAGLAGGLLGAPPSFADVPDVGLYDGFLIRVGSAVGRAMSWKAFRRWSTQGPGTSTAMGTTTCLSGPRVRTTALGFSSGSVYVVFGGGAGPVDLIALGDRGFRIDGADRVHRQWQGGCRRRGCQPRWLRRCAHRLVRDCVCGLRGQDTSTVGLANLGDRGFRIDGPAEPSRIGEILAGAGDVNGDGYDDVLLGSRSTLPEPAYVVFGGSQTTTVDLNTLGARGFRISGTMSRMGGAGDVNADGYDDLIFGDPYARPASSNYMRNSGSSYVVFGGPTTDVDLADLGDRGFRIDGTPDIQFGDWVAGAGDVNGDRVDDLLIGAPAWTPSPSWGGPPPSSYVIFGGNTDALNLKNLGDRGVKIAGSPVAAPGDVDGDGVNDLLIRTVSADDDRLVFGGVSDLGDRKVRLDGTGWSAAGGDVNGDGLR